MWSDFINQTQYDRSLTTKFWEYLITNVSQIATVIDIK